jgi:hypothetical protein
MLESFLGGIKTVALAPSDNRAVQFKDLSALWNCVFISAIINWDLKVLSNFSGLTPQE